jgi:pyruvate oxidase
MSKTSQQVTVWYRVADLDILDEGGITTVYAGKHAVCLTRIKGKYGALNNRCPHQGGPLGDGFIQKDDNDCSYVICPWHAWEYDPVSGMPPQGFDDHPAQPFKVDERKDGLYVGVIEEARIKSLMDQMVSTMTNWGIDTVFGMVGHSNLGLTEAFRIAEKEGRLRYFGIRHEGAASFAASGYAKLTGKPAACFSIAGPGATNLLTGLWDAKVDRVPILALTGQINTQVLGPGAFQEIPLEKAFEAVAAWSQTVLRKENGTELMALALKHAIVERDVAHLIFPDEIQTEPAYENANKSSTSKRIANKNIQPPTEELEKAIKLLNNAKRPGIIVGNGARPYAKQIIALAEKIDAPIITTFKAKGIVPDSHPLACGVLGRSGTPIASAAMTKSDVILVLGASFSNHTSITTKRKLIQVDFDRMMLGKFHDVDLPIWGEIGTTVALLEKQIDKIERPKRREYIERLWGNWRSEKNKRAKKSNKENLIPNAFIMQKLSEIVPENAVITVDVGNNAYSFGMYFESKAQHVLMSGYLGSIGFAFPAALGAWAAAPKRKVIAIAGDGGFGQYLAEFTTAVKYKMPITLVLLNNSELAKISREQRSAEFEVWQTSLKNPDFAKFANNCGGLGIRVEEREQLEKALEKAFTYKEGPSLVEIISDSGQL